LYVGQNLWLRAAQGKVCFQECETVLELPAPTLQGIVMQRHTVREW
jgi:hypothetical protein